MTAEGLPIIDISLAEDPATKPQLLETLRNALFRIGFLYLVNHGLEKQADKVLEITPKVFDIPKEKKLELAMTNNPHFVGYTGLGAETTAKHIDIREQFDFGSSKDTDYKPGDPQWKKLRGPSPYPSEEVLPGFQQIIQDYLDGMDSLASRLLELVAECLNLPDDSFTQFQGKMNRLKLVKYPPATTSPVGGATLHDGQSFQGVGPHKDSSGMFTFVLQDSVGGLEVLDSTGEWIAARPIKDSFVVNIAQGFEALTGGRCGATTHQVVSPTDPTITRYSVPYFYSVRLDLTQQDITNQLSFITGKIPEPIDHAKRLVDVPSEFIQPQYSCVSIMSSRTIFLQILT